MEIKKIGEYHDLYLKSGTSFLANVFKNWKIVLKIYHFDPAKFHSAPGLASQAAFKKTELKLELLTAWYDINGWKRN